MDSSPTLVLTRRKEENSRLLREDLAQGRVWFRALPEVVTLNHTDLCNLRCVMCPRNLAQGTHRLSRRVLAYLAEELFPTARKLVLTTSGGEPLAVDFDFLLDRSLTHGVQMDVVTNGVLLTRELYRHARTALDHLNVSLDCHVPEVYEKIRLGARFEVVMANLHAIREERLACPDDVLYSTSAVVMRSNLPHLPEFVRFAATLGFEAVVLQRLLHSVKHTPEEDPVAHCGEAAILEAFERAAQMARECGINLYRSEFGQAPVLVRPLRAKRPDPLLSHRLCWFMAQNFSVMYTGEVYPCCVPTDHLLGNVLYEDPVAIWNGEKAQALRRAQVTGQGTLFCSGCLHAPHLKPRRWRTVNETLRVARRALRHFLGGLERKLQSRYATPMIDPRLPRTTNCEGGFAERREFGVATPIAALRNEVVTVSPEDGAIFLVREGVLFRSEDSSASPEHVLTLRDAPAPRATALRFAAPRVMLVAFEGEGQLLRVRLDGARTSVETALVLSDPRTFVRQHGLVRTRSGEIFAAEYGVFAGAHGGRVYRAPNALAPFSESLRLSWARHVHTVFARRNGGLLVTTGDLAGQRRLLTWSGNGGAPRTLQRAWSGYTAIVETANALHFGTELRDNNALLRRDPGLRKCAELRRLPDRIDLQVRDLVDLGDGHLAALLGMDADQVDRREGRRAALLLSTDEGASWSIAHEFAADWSDAPEALLQLPGARPKLLSVCADIPVLFEWNTSTVL